MYTFLTKIMNIKGRKKNLHTHSLHALLSFGMFTSCEPYLVFLYVCIGISYLMNFEDVMMDFFFTRRREYSRLEG